MAKFTEYKVMMYMNGKWKSGMFYDGRIMPYQTDKESCVKMIQKEAERCKRFAEKYPDKKLPEKWSILYREVTTTNWLEYV